MCHTDKKGDGCHATGVGGCGGNLLQTNLSKSAGVRGIADRLIAQALEVRSSLASYRSLRG